ncbi:unnamed protein product [Schistosoma curassoni]|uniref:Ovule protein n=1 Tax=Schistosoma curassoni TaxID=6186 RepID=A0A183JHU4_9TREM|nr:unnamed protein product [Schistosoma curassoni]
MVRCGLFGWYINPVCLEYMLHIAEVEIDVLDFTGGARQEAGPIKTMDCSYGLYASLVRSINYCSLISVIITLYINKDTEHKF